MNHLWRGIQNFHHHIRPNQRERFEELAETNAPLRALLACSDPRLVTCLKFGAEPGDWFQIRTAGNCVPPYGRLVGETQASIALALKLGVSDFVILGHTDCGAMKGLRNPVLISDNEAMMRVLQESCTCGCWVNGETDERMALFKLAKLHVIQQMCNLQTYPTVKERLAEGSLRLHGLVFDIKEARFHIYNEETCQFEGMEFPHPLEVGVDLLSA
jgi:carbonic anhydrase